MATYGPNIAGTGANDATVGSVAWNNPTYITADDTNYAEFNSIGISQYLKATNFGFSIPSDQTIDGITVEIHRKGSLMATVVDSSIKIIKGGSIVGTDKSAGATWPTTFTTDSFGGTSDLWGTTWTYSDINDSTFGVVVACDVTSGMDSINVDYIQITVTTSSSGGGGSDDYWYHSFLTFQNLSVPNGVTINKAFVRFTAQSAGSYGNDLDDVNTMIFGNDVDSSTSPTDAASANAAVLTTSCVSWDNIAHWTDDTTYDTPDISCIVQEIVDRAGWTSGNDLGLQIQNNYSSHESLEAITRRAYDYGTTPLKSPQIYIYYTIDEMGSGGVVLGGDSLIETYLAGSGGVVVAGESLITGSMIEVGSGGVVVAGDSINSYGSDRYGSGGAVVAGEAIDTTDNPTKYPEGGVVVAGDSILSTSIIGSGGVVVNSALWRNRKVLTVPSGSIGEDFDKFYLPVATIIGINDNENKVKFTTLSGENLYHEIRDYESDTGKLWATVKLPLESGSDNDFYIYYGWNL